MPQKMDPPDDLRGALPFTTVAGKALELVQRVHERAKLRGGIPGVPTGLKSLDAALGGLQRGLHLLGASPGAGKTALALNIARHAAAQYQLPVVYASFDELPERLALKVLAQAGKVSASEMGGGRTDPAKVATLIDQHAAAHRTLSFVCGDSKLTAADLMDQLQDRMKAQGQDTGLLVVDYLQPWAATYAGDSGKEMRHAVGSLAFALREIANQLDVAVLVVSALSRSGQEKDRPTMTSFRESSDLEYGADSILALSTDDSALTGSGKRGVCLDILKNRFGASNQRIALVLDGATQIMVERVGS